MVKKTHRWREICICLLNPLPASLNPVRRGQKFLRVAATGGYDGSRFQQGRDGVSRALMEVIGPFAVPYDEHGEDGSNEAMEWTAQIAPSYFNYRKVSIFGGSNEIQRNIITKAVLGL
jgi:hypothetical protein